MLYVPQKVLLAKSLTECYFVRVSPAMELMLNATVTRYALEVHLVIIIAVIIIIITTFIMIILIILIIVISCGSGNSSSSRSSGSSIVLRTITFVWFFFVRSGDV